MTMRSMRPRWGVVLALAAVLLSLAPAMALAGPRSEFRTDAVMTPGPGSAGWSITPGDVSAAGKSGRFVVQDRTLAGVFAGAISGPFGFTFHTNVPLLTQSGQFQGTLTIAGVDGVTYVANVHGSSSLAGGPVLAYYPGAALPGLPPNIVVAIQLQLTGGFTFTDGARGNGALEGKFTVAIDPVAGHILFLVPSFLPLFDPATFAPVGFSDTHATLQGELNQ